MKRLRVLLMLPVLFLTFASANAGIQYKIPDPRMYAVGDSVFQDEYSIRENKKFEEYSWGGSDDLKPAALDAIAEIGEHAREEGLYLFVQGTADSIRWHQTPKKKFHQNNVNVSNARAQDVADRLMVLVGDDHVFVGGRVQARSDFRGVYVQITEKRTKFLYRISDIGKATGGSTVNMRTTILGSTIYPFFGYGYAGAEKCNYQTVIFGAGIDSVRWFPSWTRSVSLYGFYGENYQPTETKIVGGGMQFGKRGFFLRVGASTASTKELGTQASLSILRGPEIGLGYEWNYASLCVYGGPNHWSSIDDERGETRPAFKATLVLGDIY